MTTFNNLFFFEIISSNLVINTISLKNDIISIKKPSGESKIRTSFESQQITKSFFSKKLISISL